MFHTITITKPFEIPKEYINQFETGKRIDINTIKKTRNKIYETILN